MRFAAKPVVALFAVLLLAATAYGATPTGRVVGITDGDTITALIPRNAQYRIRLAGIDAPEHNQAFGARSKQNLSRLVYGKNVTLDCGKAESYGRLICKVTLHDGKDACLAQIKAGLAWNYKQFQNEQTPQDRKVYAAAEDAAREAHIGLWSQPHPTPPWDFRHHTPAKLCFNHADQRIACSGLYHGPVRGNRRSGIFEWPGSPTTTRSRCATG